MDTSILTTDAKGDPAGILLEWYDANRRNLPWREDPSPYHVWLSEIMLQQTRVEAVREYYTRFLASLPTIETLAKAEEDVYLKLWEGLGYYSRVRNLHKAAVQIMEEHDGQMPASSAELQKLAGIGPYTAAAIASICFNERIPAIDGNLLRVFSRMTGYAKNIKADAAKKAAREWYLEIFPKSADSESSVPEVESNTVKSENVALGSGDTECTVPVRRYGDMNQALMDLGAGVCLPNGLPLCGECPWADRCAAHAAGRETELPVTPLKKQRAIEKKTVFLIYYDQKLALRKREESGLLAGLYEFPNTEGNLSREEALAYVESLGFSAVRLQRLPAAKHIFSHREWHMSGWQVLADEWEPFDDGRPREHELFLASAEELAHVYSIPSAFAKYQREIRKDFL